MQKFYNNILALLKQRTNWVAWSIICGAPMKSPFNIESLLSGYPSPAKARVKGTWGNYLDAVECVRLGLARRMGYEFDGDSHDVKPGTDIHGNITRLGNKLDGLAETLKNCEG